MEDVCGVLLCETSLKAELPYRKGRYLVTKAQTYTGFRRLGTSDRIMGITSRIWRPEISSS